MLQGRQTIWCFQSHTPFTTSFSEQLGQLRRLFTSQTYANISINLPHLVDAHTAIYEPVNGPGLLCDALFSNDPRILDFEAVFSRLCDFLGHLHALQIEDLPVAIAELRPPWTSVNAAQLASLAEARHRLPLAATPKLVSWAADAKVVCGENDRLIHGHASTAAVSCLARGETLAMLDWLEFGVGNPLVDFSHLLSEVVEAVAGNFVKLDFATRLAKVLISTEPVDQLRNLAARAIINHQNLRAWMTGEGAELGPYLVAAESALADLMEEIAA